MHRQALGPRQRGSGDGERLDRVVEVHLAHAAAEHPRREARREARRAVRRQAVVRAGDVVAEGGRARTAHEDRAGGAHAGRQALRGRPDELEVLGRERLGEGQRRVHRRRVGERDARRIGRRAVGRELGDLLGDGVQQRGVVGRRRDDGLGPVLALGEQVEGDEPRVGGPVGDDEDVAGAVEPVDPHAPRHLALGLLAVEVARAADDVDAPDLLRPVGERRDGVGAAHRVDLGDAQQRRGAPDDRVHGWRRGDADLLDARGAGGDDAHDERGGQRHAPAGDVDAGAADRHLAQHDPLALRQRDLLVVADRRSGDEHDVGDRGVQAGLDVGCQRHRQLVGGQAHRAAVAAVVPGDELAQRGVAAVAHGRDERGHRVGDRRAARGHRACLRRRGLGVLADREAFNAQRAPPRSRAAGRRARRWPAP